MERITLPFPCGTGQAAREPGRHSGARPRSGQCYDPPCCTSRLSSPQVVTVENGPGADDAAIQRAIKHPRNQPITILLRPGSLEAGTCYSISGPIDLASNVTIDSASPPDRWCMQRATLPRDPNSPSPELRWFSVTGAAVDNFTMRNANLTAWGREMSFEKQVSYVDRGSVFTSACGTRRTRCTPRT